MRGKIKSQNYGFDKILRTKLQLSLNERWNNNESNVEDKNKITY